ncbi:MAG: hypothetical protein WCB68_20995 [Pyrinomonadaceae bacterium]
MMKSALFVFHSALIIHHHRFFFNPAYPVHPVNLSFGQKTGRGLVPAPTRTLDDAEKNST